jgi:hypothetical protein
MKSVVIRGREIELKFTFNSMNYMQEFDLSVFEKLETMPFMIYPTVLKLMMGAVNHDPKVKIPEVLVQELLETKMEEENLSAILTDLMGLLEESRFFKALQKMNE